MDFCKLKPCLGSIVKPGQERDMEGFLRLIGFICAYLHMFMNLCEQVPMEVRREHQISLKWSCRQL